LHYYHYIHSVDDEESLAIALSLQGSTNINTDSNNNDLEFCLSIMDFIIKDFETVYSLLFAYESKIRTITAKFLIKVFESVFYLEGEDSLLQFVMDQVYCCFYCRYYYFLFSFKGNVEYNCNL
jgi:hypothetical protein